MERLKVGDSVEIFWERTDYIVDFSYKRHGVIVGKKPGFDVISGKFIVKYEVGNFNEENMSYTLSFKENELVKIPETTKRLEPKWIYDDVRRYQLEGLFNSSKITFHKSILGNMHKTILDYTLPTKVVFDINKRKTTLLFGDKPYEHVVSGIAHKSDTFDTASGFFIQLAKHILKDKWKDKIKLWEYLSNNDFETVKMMIFNFVLTHLKEEFDMSFRQLDKLTHWDFKKPIKFEIKGIKHTIEVEHKFNRVKEVKKTKGDKK
ncbi:MAG: hypothetical protein WC939_00270 [Acholeplasmataceae bacterium]